MVADLKTNRAQARWALMTAIRAGLESLTVPGPSAVLETTYRNALRAVMNRPTAQERAFLLDQAWEASDLAIRLLRAGDRKPAEQMMGEMYRHTREAISATSR